MQVDPKVTFVIGLLTTIALIGANASLWSNALPEAAVAGVAAWNNIIGTVGTAVLTFLTGLSSSKAGPITKALRG